MAGRIPGSKVIASGLRYAFRVTGFFVGDDRRTGHNTHKKGSGPTPLPLDYDLYDLTFVISTAVDETGSHLVGDLSLALPYLP